ncbi:MAG: hypothetical protein ACE5KM_03935 [Planctomycetaceae bacterium]
MHSLRRRVALGTFLSVVLGCCSLIGPRAVAGKAVLQNGTAIEGELVPIKGLTPALIRQTKGNTESFPIIMIHNGFKRYFVPRLNVDKKRSDWTPELSPYEVFELKHRRTRRKPGPSKLGPIRVMKPWTRFGRRTVRVVTSRGAEDIVQGVTKITPRYVQVEGITHVWKHGLAITSFKPATLDAIISRMIDGKSASDRMAVIRFYIQAGMYKTASQKLDALQKDFPEFQKKAEEVRFELRQQTANRIIGELRRRRRAGQHRLVYRSCTSFPTKDVTAAVLREISQVKRGYDEAGKKADRARMLLMELESKLSDKKVLAAIQPMRSEVNSQLNYDTLLRLDAFLKLPDDPGLDDKDQEKLALAYSGWILGSGNAITNLDLTIRLWEARFLAVEYLRTEKPQRQDELIEKIRKLEGVKPEHIGWMIPYLPPIIETPDVRPGKPSVLTVAGRDGKPPLRYAVLLPPEYTPSRSYPTIVALRPEERTILTELQWWGGSGGKPGQSQRRGYIVIAPEYTDGKTGSYDYSTQAHVAVIECLRDARKRFNVDSDRVFLSGHGSGGDAAFDIGMSHPDLFAGAMPITGISDKYCMYYWSNAKHLPWYVVGGELARDSLLRNSRELSRMMRNRKPRPVDVTYVEYIGRGYESYYEEIHNLFDWMSLHKRRKYPKRIEAKVLRTSEDRFWWVRMSELPKTVTHSTLLVGKTKRGSPMTLKAWVNAGNSVNIRSGAKVHTLWLSPDLLDYTQRVRVNLSGRGTVFSGFLTRETGTLLEDLRVRGDRQKPYWTRLVVTPKGAALPAAKKLR